MYPWVRKNNLVVRHCSFDAIDASEHEELHNHVESLSATGDWDDLKKYPRLCEKVSDLWTSTKPTVFAPDATPGKFLRQLQSFSVDPEQCAEAWVLELLQANPALQFLHVNIDVYYPQRRAAKHCGGVLELALFGLRDGLDDDVLWLMSEHCPALRRLEIDNITNSADWVLPEAPMLALAQQCKQLECLTMNATAVTASAVCLQCRNLASLRVGDVTLELADLLNLLPQHRKQPVMKLTCRWALQEECDVHACATLFSGLQKLIVTVPAQCERAFSAAVKLLSGLDELGITILSATSQAADAVLYAVAEHCCLLRRLQVGKGVMSGEAVAAVVQRNKHLRSFTWHGSQAESCKITLCALDRYCPLLESVECT
jgi:hypothetical protein